MKLFFISMLSVSRRVQIWEETKQDLATDGVALQHSLACQNLHVPLESERAGEETCELHKGSQSTLSNKETARFLVLFPQVGDQWRHAVMRSRPKVFIRLWNSKCLLAVVGAKWMIVSVTPHRGGLTPQQCSPSAFTPLCTVLG